MFGFFIYQVIQDASLHKVVQIEQVPLKIEKEKEINDFKEQTTEGDSYSSELEDKSVQTHQEIVQEVGLD